MTDSLSPSYAQPKDVVLRPPSTSSAKTPISLIPPTTDWLAGAWHVTHSTLPMWNNKRNVRIEYTPLPSAGQGTEAGTDRVDDLVSYQGMHSDKVKKVHGVDKASGNDGGAWDWRGKGLLSIASSHWEILGWGEDEAVGTQWAVTYFAKTLFTPAGIDVYSRRPEGLSDAKLEGIKTALAAIEDPDIQKLASTLFEIKKDNSRTD